jgi:hypothetical protein
LFRFFVGFPLFDIFLGCVYHFSHSRHNFSDCSPKRKGDAIDESWLVLGYIGCAPVAKEGNREALVSFEVPLCEELFKQEIGPFFDHTEVS